MSTFVTNKMEGGGKGMRSRDGIYFRERPSYGLNIISTIPTTNFLFKFFTQESAGPRRLQIRTVLWKKPDPMVLEREGSG